MMLVLRALCGFAAYDIVIAVRGFQTMYSIVRNWKVSSSKPPSSETVSRVCAAINHASIWYPKRVLCLQRSFATTYILRKSGVPAQMVFGARKVPFKAHAWVEIDGQPVNERSNVFATYAVLERC
jgi:hypothetical protein